MDARSAGRGFRQEASYYDQARSPLPTPVRQASSMSSMLSASSASSAASAAAPLSARTQRHTPSPRVFGVRLAVPYEFAQADDDDDDNDEEEEEERRRREHERATAGRHADEEEEARRRLQHRRVRIVHEKETMTDAIASREVAVSTRAWL
jgi:hypothetical protein